MSGFGLTYKLASLIERFLKKFCFIFIFLSPFWFIIYINYYSHLLYCYQWPLLLPTNSTIHLMETTFITEWSLLRIQNLKTHISKKFCLKFCKSFMYLTFYWYYFSAHSVHYCLCGAHIAGHRSAKGAKLPVLWEVRCISIILNPLWP